MKCHNRYFKLDLGINEDVGEAIYNQIWKIRTDIDNSRILERSNNEKKRTKAVKWSNKIFDKNSKRLKKEVCQLIDYETKNLSNLNIRCSNFYSEHHPRCEKSVYDIEDEKEKNKRKEFILCCMCVIFTSIGWIIGSLLK